MWVCLLKGNMSFPDSAGGRGASNITSPLAQTSWMKGFQEKVKRVKRCSAHPDFSADVISQCHVRSACVVTTVAQGLDVGMVGKNPWVLKEFKCWHLLWKEASSMVAFSIHSTKELQPGWGRGSVALYKKKACLGSQLLLGLICTLKCALMLQMSTFPF